MALIGFVIGLALAVGFLAPHSASAQIAQVDIGSFTNTTSQANNTNFTVTAAANNVLVVNLAWRSGTSISTAAPIVTYNGVALTAASLSQDSNANYSNTAVYYLFNPTAGSNTLHVDYGASLVAGSAAGFDAFTLGGVDTTQAPEAISGHNAAAANDGPDSLSVSLSNVAFGSWADASANYRQGGNGTTTLLNASIASGAGALITNGSGGTVGNGNLYDQIVDGQMITAGALVSNITTPNLTVQETGPGSANHRFTLASAVFAALHPISTWNGGATTNNWTDGANWGGTAPVAGNTLDFAGSTRPGPVNNFTSGTSFSSITFDSTATVPFTLTGAGITLTGDNSFNAIVNNSTQQQSVNLNIALGFDNLKINTGNGGLSIGGSISGNHSITLTGNSPLVLAAANTYTGPTNISSAQLQLNNANAVQNSTVNVNLANSLLFGPGIGSFNLGGLSGTAGVSMNATDNSPVSLVIGGNNASTGYLGNLTGGGGITKVGTGTLSLGGTNSYAGPTLIQGGTLKLSASYRYYQFQATTLNNNAAANSIQLSEVQYFDATNTWVPAIAVTNPGGNNSGDGAPANANDANLATKWLDFNKFQPLVYDFGAPTALPHYNLATANDAPERDATGWTISGSNDGITFTPLDTQSNITDPTNRLTWYNGGGTGNHPTTFFNISLAANNAIPSTTAVVMSSNTTLDMTNDSVTIASLADAAGPTPTGSHVLLGNGTLTTGDNTNTVFSGAISGAGGSLVKVGSGNFTLAGVNSYSGPTTISNGTLSLTTSSNSNIASSPTITIASGAFLNVTGVTGAGGFTVGGSTPQTLTVSGAGTSTVTGNLAIGSAGTLIQSSSNSLAVAGGLTLAGGSTSNFTITSTGAALVAATGSLSIAPTGGISTVNIGSGSTFPHASVTYDLFSHGGSSLASGFSSLKLGTVPPLFTYTLLNNPNEVDLQVVPFEFAWTGKDNATGGSPGSSDSVWTSSPGPFPANSNWVNTLTGVSTQYADGSRVIFGDNYPNTSAGTNNVLNSTVTIQAGGVAPGAVVFTNTGASLGGVDYTVGNAGAAGISAAASGIQLQGSGQVTLAGANSFTGAVTVSAGTLNLTNSAALGNSSGVTIASHAGLVLNNLTAGLTVTGSNPIPLSIDNAGTPSGPAANGVLTANGTSGYAGPITVVNSTGSSTIHTVNSADNLTLSGGINLPNGGTLTFNGPGTTTVSGGPIAEGSSPGTIAMNGTGRLNLSSAANYYAGGTQINSGLVVPSSFAALGTGPVIFAASSGTLRISPPSANSPFLGGAGTGANQWTVNSGAAYTPAQPSFSGNTLTMTNNQGGENTSAWFNTPVSIKNGFATSFNFQSLPSGGADGVTFALQSVNNATPLNSLGGGGGSLGYAGIGNSAAFQIEVFGNAGVRWASNGTTGGDTATGGVGLNSGDLINVALSYNPVSTTLTANLTDTVTGAAFTYTNSSFNLAGVLGGNNAYIGFTGGTGGAAAVNSVSNFSFPGPGNPPPIVVNPGNTGTVDVAATVASPTIAVGQFTGGAGSQLNVTATTVITGGQAYGLSIPSAVLIGTTTFNVANAAGGGAGTLTLANVADGASPGAITKIGPGTLRVNSAVSNVVSGTGFNQISGNSYTGGTTISQGTVVVGGAFLSPLGAGTVTLNGGRLQLQGGPVGTFPLATTGYTGDVISDASEPTTTPYGSNTTLEGTRVLYSSAIAGIAAGGGGPGLPVNGTIVDNSNPSTVFQLQSYTANNVLQLSNSPPNTPPTSSGVVSTGNLTLTNPGKFQTLAILENAGNANQTYSATLNFAGGSTLTFSGLTAVNYMNTAPPTVIVPGRHRQDTGAFSTVAAIFETDINIPVADQNLTLNSITFTSTTATGNNFVNIYGVSGTATGAVAGYSQTASVAASSTIDVTGTASAGLLGNVTMGNASAAPITLAITGGSTGAGAAYSLGLGSGSGSSVSLTGSNTQYVLDVANNGAGAGTLVLGPLGDGGTARNVLVQNGGTVKLTSAGSLVAGSSIAVGGGASGGNLRVTNAGGSATGSAPVSVNSNGTLGGTGAIGSLVTVNSGGTVLGVNGATLALSGGLRLTAGSSSSINLSGTPNGTTTPGTIDVTGGTLNVVGASTVNFTGSPPATLANYTYDLFSYSPGSVSTTQNGSGLTFAAGNGGGSIAIGSQPLSAGYQYSLVNNTGLNQIDLTLTDIALTWTGQTDGSWNLSSTNWATVTPTATSFSNGKAVVFADKNPLNSPNNVTNTTITVQAAGVQPALINFTNTGVAHGGVDYTITNASGTIGIAGTTTVSLNGTGGVGGQVTLQGANSFTGPVAINAGQLNLANAAALGNATGVTVASGTTLNLTNLGGVTIYGLTASGATPIPLSLSGTGLSLTGALTSGGTNTYSGPIAIVSGGATIGTIASSDQLTLGGGVSIASGSTLTLIGAGTTIVDPISDGGVFAPGSITVAGTGTVSLPDANSYFGSTTVTSGTLNLGNGAALGNSSGATVAAGSSLSLTIPTGASATFGNLAGGPGTIGLTINGAGTTGSPGALNSVSGINTYAGPITVGASNAATINSISTLNNDGLTLSNTVSVGTGATLTFAGVGNTTVSGGGSITGAGGIAKIGAGTLTLNTLGNNYAGGTRITAGMVVASNSASLGGGTVTFANSGNSGTLRVNPALIPAGFGGNGNGWRVNSTGIATAPFPSPNVLQLTDGAGGEARSAFYGTQIPFQNAAGTGGFSTSFVYTPNGGADGATFVLQTDTRGVNAIGDTGGGMGLGTGGGTTGAIAIAPSAELEINIYGGHPQGTAFDTNGANIANGGPELFTQPGTLNVASGDPIRINLSYNPSTTTLSETDTDLTTNVTGAKTYSVNIFSALGGTSNTAFVGFTGGTGGVSSTQQISNFQYTVPVGSPSDFGNNLVLNGGALATIDVAPSPAAAVFGTLTINSGGPATLNVTEALDTVGAGQAYSLITGNVSLASNVTFNVANSSAGGVGTLTLGAVSDTGVGAGQSVTKTGAGTLVLASSTGSTYLGGTTISGGAVRVANASGSATGSGAVTVGGTSTLGVAAALGAASISGNVSVSSGGGLVSASVGSQTSASLTLSSALGLSLAAGTTSSFALNGIGTNNTTNSNALIYVSAGPFSVAGTNAVSISGHPATGVYDLYGYTSGPTSTTNFTTPAAPAGYAWSLAVSANGSGIGTSNPSANQLDLVVTQVPLTWNGAAGGGGIGVWDTTSQNWAAGLPGIAAIYANGDAVSFGDTDAITGSPVTNTAVTVRAGGVTPLSVTFTNTSVTYTFSDATGDTVGISGGTAVVVSGGGSVTFTNPNTYTGGTTVTSGTLVTSGTGTLGSGSLEVDGNGVSASVVSVQNNLAVPSLTGSVSGSGSATVNVGAGNTLTLNAASGTATFAGSVALAAGATANSGGTLTKSGGSAQVFTGAPQLGNNSVLNVGGGSLKFNVATGSATVGAGVTANVTGAATLELANAVSALSDGTAAHSAQINNSSTAAAGLLVSGAGSVQRVGGIDGIGTTQVNSGNRLTANHIVQGSLVIGGTSTSAALVTIDASDASGNPLAGSDGFALAGSLTPTAPFASGGPSSPDLLTAGGSSSSGSSLSGVNPSVGLSAVPEPSSVLLLILGGCLSVLLPAIRRRRR
jgi:autotransporter-associated beta strand protein